MYELCMIWQASYAIVNEFEYKWEHMATECIWENNGLQVEWKYDEMTSETLMWNVWNEKNGKEIVLCIEKWVHMKHMKAYEYDIERNEKNGKRNYFGRIWNIWKHMNMTLWE